MQHVPLMVAETNAGVPESIWHHDDNAINWYPYYKEGFITEKTFRTIANGHPVIWVSSPGTVAVMKRLGFKTYFSNCVTLEVQRYW